MSMISDLDKQLAELALINKIELNTPAGGGVAGGVGTPRKVGPAVPPKPQKKQLPLVPQSYQLKQTVEPSYASRLSSTNNNNNNNNATPQFYSNLPSNQSTLPIYSNTPPKTNLNINKISAPSSGSSTYSNVATPKAYVKPSTNSTSSGVDYVTYSNLAPPTNALPQAAVPQTASTGRPPRTTTTTTDNNLIYSNLMHAAPPMYGNTNNNAQSYTNGEELLDDLPPPPPPPLLDLSVVGTNGGVPRNSLGGGDYAACNINTNLPPPPEDLLPPPSPVSSSYSELRRATQSTGDYHGYIGSQTGDNDSLYGYGGMSQSSSTYESIYEPINPRPPSQLSSRSNYSLYAPYGGSTGSALSGPSQSVSRIGGAGGGGSSVAMLNEEDGGATVNNTTNTTNNNVGTNENGGLSKEQEVDSLTNLLVQNMGNGSAASGGGGGTDGAGDHDVYGICIKCGEKIVGENSGCTAMDHFYHTKCFTCHHCAINLQGKPFYALDGKPFCEEDYLNTLEKCCVCQKPILDRILRATGKPYHPQCFCCVACGKSLDGIPFTVDATNRVHCIEDFHRIFAPRCWVCKLPIMPEPGEEETVRVVALDHSFHIQCYKCEDCGLVLSSEAEGRGCYPLDGHVLCKSCNAKRVQALTSHMTTEL